MKSLSASILLLVALSSPLAVGQRPGPKTLPEPTQTTVCSVFADPSNYNNRLVRVRGYVKAGSEYSLLLDERCSDSAIWFVLGDGSSPPQLAVLVNGHGRAGGTDSQGRHTTPLPITLVKDRNFLELTRYLELSAKGEACTDSRPTESIPDCTTYRVTATFSGRIDGVSKQLHAAHMKRSSAKTPDGNGFGHMGMFDAQIVVRSVENVIAVDETNLRDAAAKSEK
jgi:hypothetical protein